MEAGLGTKGDRVRLSAYSASVWLAHEATRKKGCFKRKIFHCMSVSFGLQKKRIPTSHPKSAAPSPKRAAWSVVRFLPFCSHLVFKTDKERRRKKYSIFTNNALLFSLSFPKPQTSTILRPPSTVHRPPSTITVHHPPSTATLLHVAVPGVLREIHYYKQPSEIEAQKPFLGRIIIYDDTVRAYAMTKV